METSGVEEFAYRQPTLAGLRLTLKAVPISTRVVGDGLIAMRYQVASCTE
jgi:hypothetical protein